MSTLVLPAPFGPTMTVGPVEAWKARSMVRSPIVPAHVDLERAHERAPARTATSSAKATATSTIERLWAVRRSDSSAA